MVTGQTVTRYGLERWTEVGSGPPVLLLHGIYAGAGAHEWDALVPLLTTRSTVRSAELLGFGASDRPAQQFTRDVVMEGVRSLVDDAPSDATVVASSLTGAYALAAIAASSAPRRLVLVTPTGLGKTQSGGGPLAAAAEVALRRTPLGDALALALTSRPSVKWFLSKQAYADGKLVDDAVVDAYHRSGQSPTAKYPLVAFVTNQLSYRVDPSAVTKIRPAVVWAEAQKFTNEAERDRWSAAGAHVVSLRSGQPQAEEPEAVADVILSRIEEASAPPTPLP